MSKGKIILVYPKVGMSGSLVQHMPLSILYAGVDSIRHGFEVDPVDVRLDPRRWQENIAAKITPDTFLLGISVMTGSPIRNATEISLWMKKNYPQISIVWGGPHATFNGLEILNESAVDYAIAGYGSKALALLANYLHNDADAPMLASIAGLIYRDNGKVTANPPEDKFEIMDYRDIPYHLIEKDMPRYGQLDTDDRIFPMYSAMGCPYRCAFCSSPAQYRNITKRYEILTVQEVVDHIEYVHKKYSATYIYFIDDDSFVNPVHVDEIISEIDRRNIKIRLGFRGARVNEIKKMSDEYLDGLARAGTTIMHIGIESGSQRILDLVHKDCTVEDIIAVNLKMARHPEIKTGYNWIVGIPGETLDDLRKTQTLMLKVINDNPNAILFTPNLYRPLPGTELYDLALKFGYKKPEHMEDWANNEVEGNYQTPWCSKHQAAMINMMQVTSYFVDNKVFKVETGNSLKFRIIRILAYLYKPLAVARLKYGISGFLIENTIFRMVSSLYRN
jgi:anaerobic magnesium-protoporphyrin IX monomethyl ester cyclase